MFLEIFCFSMTSNNGIKKKLLIFFLNKERFKLNGSLVIKILRRACLVNYYMYTPRLSTPL